MPPAALALGAGVAQAVLAGQVPPSRASRVAAFAVTIASAGLLLSSVAAFRREGTTVDPLAVERAEALVTGGACSMTRNPMYLSMAGLLLAHATLRRSWAAIVPAGAFLVLIDRMQIPAEEEALRKQFGSAFDDYARRTPRWLGSHFLSPIRSPHH